MELTFVEELLLLGIDDESGNVRAAGDLAFNMALAGAVLADLVRRRRIASSDDRMWLLDSAPTGEPVLDRFLHDFESVDPDETPQYWVRRVYDGIEAIVDLTLRSLVDKGVLREEEGRYLWLFSQRRYPTVEDKPEREVKHRLFDVIFSDSSPGEDDRTLLALCHAGGVLETILSEHELKQCAERIREVSEGDLVSAAAVDIVAEVNRQLELSGPVV